MTPSPPEIRSVDMPAELRILLDDYPRDAWEAHPNFAKATRNWLFAHQGFRQLSHIVTDETERFLDKNLGAEELADGLGYYGDILVRNLHGHHGWEDRSYFPELAEADPRVNRGLELLESDHATLNAYLDQFVRQANRVIQLVQLDESEATQEVGPLNETAAAISALLDRHLPDEEDLAVPVILHHKLRG